MNQILPVSTGPTFIERQDMQRDIESEDLKNIEASERVAEYTNIMSFLRTIPEESDAELCSTMLLEDFDGPGSVKGYEDNIDRLWIGDFEITHNGAWRVKDLQNDVPTETYGSLLEALRVTIAIIRDFKS